MLSEKILLAMNDTEDVWLEAAGDRLGCGRKNQKKKTVRLRSLPRRAVLLAAALAAFLSLGAVAYAANAWGIQTLFNNANRQLPGQAAELIQTRTETAQGEGFSAAVTETLCDDSLVLMTVRVAAGEEYLLVSDFASPQDGLQTIGREGEGTLADYAAEQGKKLLHVGAGLSTRGNGGPVLLDGSLSYAAVSDSEAALLLIADRAPAAGAAELVCTGNAWEEGSQEVRRLEIPVRLENVPAQSVETFVPTDPDAIPGLRIGEATVTKTPLGVSVEYAVTPEDMDAFENIMKLSFDELTDYEGGTVLDDDGIWRTRITMGRGLVTDTLTVHFYDWDKQPLGEIVFVKK